MQRRMSTSQGAGTQGRLFFSIYFVLLFFYLDTVHVAFIMAHRGKNLLAFARIVSSFNVTLFFSCTCVSVLPLGQRREGTSRKGRRRTSQSQRVGRISAQV